MQNITYTYEEVIPAEYLGIFTASYLPEGGYFDGTGSGTVTNTYAGGTPITYEVEKVWSDGGAANSNHPTITVTLSATTGDATLDEALAVKLNASGVTLTKTITNTQSGATWTNLPPQFMGKTVDYSVTEEIGTDSTVGFTYVQKSLLEEGNKTTITKRPHGYG